VAICPELPENLLKMKETHNLHFDILSDLNNEYAEKLGITFELNDEMADVYKDFKIDLASTQGNDKNRLPVPAIFIIDTDGTILHVHADIDYNNRFEPSDALKYL